MKKLSLFISFSLCVWGLLSQNKSTLEANFITPPSTAKPYVWWHWMGPNFSKAGITKDLEAMRAAGIGGATIFNLASAVQESHVPTENNPWSEQKYRSPAYWEAIRHAAAEAQRLGLEIGLHNTAGYSTTGGPWVSEDKAMQTLVWSKTSQSGGTLISVKLAKPEPSIWEGWGSPKIKATFYKDIAVLAVPVQTQVSSKSIIDLSSKMDAQGQLQWEAPAGDWLIYRVGHAPTMANPHPLPDDIIGKTLEVDKMSMTQNRFHWQNVLNPLQEKLAPYLGKSFKHILIDSYEAGDQNWTPDFRQEFVRRKGYDPIPWVLSFDKIDQKPLVLDNEEACQRFAWDFQDVIQQLYHDNGWKTGKELIKAAGLDLQFESYGGPFNEAQGAALADLPMGEFWTHTGGIDAKIPAAAAAAGRKIVGAEALTSLPENSKYTEDPAFLKPSALKGYVSGANRLILHHWVHQPFDDRYQPGMGMGWWGTHFSRHQTWAEPGKAFFRYLARTQVLLQYGERVADYLCLEDLQGSGDLISRPDFLRQNIQVLKGKIVLESGRAYAFLVLPNQKSIQVEVAEKIKALVAKGGSVVGPKPEKALGLKGYPSSDQKVASVGNALWSYGPQAEYGQGLVFKNIPDAMKLHKIQAEHQVEKADSSQYIRVLHRTGPEGEVYFVANLAPAAQNVSISFRVKGKQPELWQAENASIQAAPIWQEKDGRSWVDLQLQSQQAVFVVFRKAVTPGEHLIAISSTQKNWSIVPLQNGQHALFAPSPQQISLQYASGKKMNVDLPAASYQAIEGPWNLNLQPKLEPAFKLNFPQLLDFSQHSDPRVKYFAGTATYTKTIQVDPELLKPGKRIQLDLGQLQDIASLKINGKALGVLWHPPYVLDITAALVPGDNLLEIAVTTNWANRLIGDEQQPADFEWGSDRGNLGHAMKAYPNWFVKNQPRPEQGRKTFSVWYYYRKDSPLQPAGLVGPVRLVVFETKVI